jgi:hypothetical protein
MCNRISEPEEIPMNLQNWSRSNAEYGRKLIRSGIEGVRSARKEFFDEESVAPTLSDSIRNSVAPAVVGACIAVLGAGSASRSKSAGRALLFGLLGGAVGLSAGLAWENRRFTATSVCAALKNIGRVRDERWLIRNPINYG